MKSSDIAEERTVATNVLNSWKQIAEYVGRGVRTAEQWERELGLPVHRPRNHLRSPVMAIPSEIDEWLRSGRRLRDMTAVFVDFEPTSEMRRLRAELTVGVEVMRRTIDLMDRQVQALTRSTLARPRPRPSDLAGPTDQK